MRWLINGGGSPSPEQQFFLSTPPHWWQANKEQRPSREGGSYLRLMWRDVRFIFRGRDADPGVVSRRHYRRLAVLFARAAESPFGGGSKLFIWLVWRSGAGSWRRSLRRGRRDGKRKGGFPSTVLTSDAVWNSTKLISSFWCLLISVGGTGGIGHTVRCRLMVSLGFFVCTWLWNRAADIYYSSMHARCLKSTQQRRENVSISLKTRGWSSVRG